MPPFLFPVKLVMPRSMRAPLRDAAQQPCPARCVFHRHRSWIGKISRLCRKKNSRLWFLKLIRGVTMHRNNIGRNEIFPLKGAAFFDIYKPMMKNGSAAGYYYGFYFWFRGEGPPVGWSVHKMNEKGRGWFFLPRPFYLGLFGGSGTFGLWKVRR